MKKIVNLTLIAFALSCIYITQVNYNKVCDANDKLLEVNMQQENRIDKLKKQNKKLQDELDKKIVIREKTIEPLNQFNEVEVELLCACVQAEAGEGRTIAQKYCTQVILNRINDGEFPNDITSVVMQKVNGVPQFSVAYDGSMWNEKVTDETRRNVMEILLYGGTLPDNVLYFYASDLKEDNWVKSLKTYKEVEGTVFCQR